MNNELVKTIAEHASNRAFSRGKTEGLIIGAAFVVAGVVFLSRLEKREPELKVAPGMNPFLVDYPPRKLREDDPPRELYSRSRYLI